MSVKFIFLFLFVVLCSGCTTLTESNKITADKQVSVIPESPISVFAPTYKSTAADKYSEALEIYESSPKASQGVYLHEGLVFVIICIDTKKEEIEHLKGTAMLRTVALLRECYPQLPPNFFIRRRLMERELNDDTGIYRYATVYREKDIKRKIGK